MPLSNNNKLEKPKLFRHHSSSQIPSSSSEAQQSNATSTTTRIRSPSAPRKVISSSTPVPLSSSFIRSKSLSPSPPPMRKQHNNNNTRNSSSSHIRRSSSRDLNSSNVGNNNDEINNISLSNNYPPRAPLTTTTSASASTRQRSESTNRRKQRTNSPSPARYNHYAQSSPPISPNKKSPLSHSLVQQQQQQEKYLFQKSIDKMSVSVRTIDLASRTAFEHISPILPIELSQLSALNTDLRSKQRIQRKLSPSISHCNILEQIYNIKYVRQLAWSISVHPNVDPWRNNSSISSSVKHHSHLNSRKNIRRRNDGTFYYIDRNEYISTTLPTHPPILSHIRKRLPTRADVGFPNTSEEEVRLKQTELQREAECEEVTPRLIVMISGDDIQHELEPSSDQTYHSKQQQQNANTNTSSLELNIFSPPLDASRSSTLGWRPRPFSDRPPGLQHIVVSPLEIRFDVGDIEPLICTLSLYCIPNATTTNNNNVVYGKISEDYIFPAGDWKDKYFADNNTTNTMRKKKALFCYDPLSIPNKESLYIVMQIHKTTQFDAMSAYSNSTAKSVCSTTSSSHASIALLRTPKKKLLRKPKFLKKKVAAATTPTNNVQQYATSNIPSIPKDVSSIQAKAKLTFDTLGTQFLTPIGYGIVPVYTHAENCNTDDVITWPNGLCTSLQLYSFPDIPESNDDFYMRLCVLVRDTLHAKNNQQYGYSESICSDNTSYTTSNAKNIDDTNGYTNNTSISSLPSPWRMATSNSNFNNIPMSGKAILFISMLGIDFTQVMLHVPKPLQIPSTKQHQAHNTNHPKLLVDVSGDCAIMMLRPNAGENNNNSQQQQLRRSNLVRLPPSKTPSGYSDSSDVRELLYIPSIPNHNISSSSTNNNDSSSSISTNNNSDPITPFLSKSFLNLLYLYPRSIQLLSSSSKKDNKSNNIISSMDGTNVKLNDKYFSVRIRVMQHVAYNDNDNDSDQHVGDDNNMTWNVLENIYNPAPGKQQLVKAIYTKIPHCSCIPSSSSKDNNHLQGGISIPLRDEVKIRLPLVLDGTYFLHFTLFCIDLLGNNHAVENSIDDVDSEEDSLVVIPLAETMIPLSTYSKNNIMSGKVTTIIPNGIHKMNLGSSPFQFVIETKLASSIHVSDPVIATILRDVAVVSHHREQEEYNNNSSIPVGGIGRSFSSQSGMFWVTKPTNQGGGAMGNESMLHKLDKASDGALLSHFHSIMYLLLSNLVSYGTPDLKFQSLFVAPNSSSFLTPLLPTNATSKDTYCTHLSFWMEHIKALLEMFHFIKIRFLSYWRNPQKLEYFVKDFCDGFDESCFFQVSSSDALRLNNVATTASGMSEESAAMSDVSTGINVTSETGKRMNMAMSTSTDNTPDKFGIAPVHPCGSSSNSLAAQAASVQMDALVEMAVDALEQKLLEAAVQVVVKHYSGSSGKSLHKYSSLDDKRTTIVEQSEAFFSRKAYGVSKTDRMLAEAEFEEEAARYERLWEDDETTIVYNRSSNTLDITNSMEEHDPRDDDDHFSVTSSSYDDTPPMVEETNINRYRQFPLTERVASSKSLSVTSPAQSFRGKLAGTIDTTNGFAKRVNSVAQVMIAPCIAPKLAAALNVGNSPTWNPRKSRNTLLLFQHDSKPPAASKNVESGFRGMSCPTNCCTDPKGSSHESGVLMVPSHFQCCIKEEQNEVPTKTGTESSICDPGSDVEEELDHYGSNSNIRHLSSQFQSVGGWTYEEHSKLRGRHIYESTPLEFSLQFSSFKKVPNQSAEKGRPFFYEICFGLWISSWMDYGVNQDKYLTSNKSDKVGSVISEHAAIDNLYDLSLSTRDSITLCFAAHLDFLLPLCLKSIVLRCSAINTQLCSVSVPISIFDAKHMQVLLIMVEIWATGLYTQALSSQAFEQEDHTSSPSTPPVIQLSDALTDFFIGLLAIIHPAQVSLLLEKYLFILKSKEPTPPKNRTSFKNSSIKGDDVTASSWTGTDLLSLQCSQRLRLHFVERVAVISQFVALNFPFKYPKNEMKKNRNDSNMSSWTNQISENMDISNVNSLVDDKNCPYPDGLHRLPREHWLAELLVNECLSICMLSCESIVAEAMAHLKNTSAQNFNANNTSDVRRRNMVLSRDALIQFQNTAMQSITCLYNHLLRRHCMDARYQSEEGRTRIASLFVCPLIKKTLEGVKVLSRMEPTHKVRILWLLCFLYIHQEAPEVLIRKQMRNSCGFKSSELYSIHKYIRILKLGSVTFQRFINWNNEEQQNDSDANLNYIDGFVSENSTWLVQESFNTLCATAILLVDECTDIIYSSQVEFRKMAYSIFDLLLHILAIPHSSVTHLRALGGASHALSKFSVSVFLKSASDNLQHWARVVLTLMNSTSLSVRSMAVDFIVSLLGGVFDMHGNIDEISLSFVTVMPEIVAREIGLYCMSRQITSMCDIECCLWPLRRAFADVEETDSVDDDRVDAQLSPLLAIFCRTCQAIIDGVLIELRLMGKECQVIGTHVDIFSSLDDAEKNEGLDFSDSWAFDADEESLYEAADFFLPETAPLQRIRWLMTLKSLHESKSQWVEAAETLFLCARTIADSILHIKSVWRPSRFNLWQDTRRSLWLSTIGESSKSQGTEIGNSNLIEFANRFLEPPSLLNIPTPSFNEKCKNNRLHQPTVSVMCKMLTNISKEGVSMYLKEDGMESLAYLRLEQVLKNIMDVVDNGYTGQRSSIGLIHGTLFMEENAALRKLSASVNSDMTKLAERMLLLADKEENEENITSTYDNNKFEHPVIGSNDGKTQPSTSQYYVRVILLGKKPERFKESTAIPTFLEWETPSICRVKQAVLRASTKSNETSEQLTTNEKEACICSAFAKPLISALSKELPIDSIVLRMNMPSESVLQKEAFKKTFVVVSLVHMSYPGYANAQLLRDSSIMEILSAGGSKRFLFYSRESPSSKHIITGKSIINNSASNRLPSSSGSGLMELTVGLRFPCALSRQRTIITSEYFS